jgi:hypothetical protein
LGSPCAWSEIEGWVEAAKVASAMEHNRLGLMGHYYGGMLDRAGIGVIALRQFLTCVAEVSRSGARSGAQVASLRSPILRSSSFIVVPAILARKR